MKRIILFFYLILLLNSFLYANQNLKVKSSIIKGYVLDMNTMDPLIGANVFFKGTVLGAATNKEGYFIIRDISPGTYVLKVTYIGYKDYEEKIKINPGEVIKKVIKLKYVGAGEAEEIVITAQARGQFKAINEQLSSTDIKNVVSSDRIQELPDANAAESVGRLPGVSILREGGEGNKVVIRGLSPKYNKIMVDGIEIASTDAEDRSTDISMITPYSLEGIEVVKAATADQDADYIGGSVNFKLRKAEPGFKYDFIAQNTYNDLRKSFNNYMFIGAVSNRFFNDKLGIFFQGNIESKDRGSNQMGASYYMLTHNVNKINPVRLENLYLTNNFRLKKRYGGSLTLDYNIPNGNIYLKNFLSIGNTNLRSYQEVYDVRNRGHSYSTTTQKKDLMILNNVLNYEQKFGRFSLNCSAAHAYSRNKVPEDISFNFAEPSPALPGGLTELPPDSIPYYAFNNIDKAYWSDVGDNQSYTEERQIILKADMQMGFYLSNQINGKLKMGGKYRSKERKYDFNATGGTMALGSGQTLKNAILEAFPWMQKITPLGSRYLSYKIFIDKNFSHGKFLKGKYTLGPVADVNLMRDVIKFMRKSKGLALDTYRKLDMSSITNDYNGSEHLSAGYLMGDINLSSMVKFIPGVRYEHNITRYTGVRGNSGSAFPEVHYPHTDTTTQRTNSYLLPMIHLQVKPLSWLQLRFAYTKTLSRPDYDLIIPRMDVGRSEVVYNNYKLKPEQAENFDLYLAAMNNYLGLFTFGLFKKNIKDMIFWMDRRVMLDPSKYGLGENEKSKFIVTQENMDKMAKVRGFEVDWQTQFWYLPSFLKGLVLNVNYTHIISEAKYPRTVIKTEYLLEPPYGVIQKNVDTTYTQRLIDQPDDILNLSLGYDYKGFSIRASMLYQANIFVGPNFYPELRSYSNDYLRWDIAVKQDLPWDGLQLYCNLNNISNTTDITHNGANKLPTSMDHYGMTIDLGLRWRLK